MRAAIALLIGFVLLVLQSTLLKLSPVHLAAPNLGLLVTLYAGLASWPLGVAAIVGLVSGYLLDLVSGAPQGVHAFVFILMALAARTIASRVAVRGVVLAFATAF